MKENELANTYLKAIDKWFEDKYGNIVVSYEDIWELAQMLARMAQPKKSYQELYNSPEGRKERKKLLKKNKIYVNSSTK